MSLLVPYQKIESQIHIIRGHKVMLDSDLGNLYEVSTKRLNEQVHRNKDRFPSDFMFQLMKMEYESLRSQFATLEIGRGKHRKFLPYVFTEHGAMMLASVLNSKRAVKMSIFVVRAFNKLRELAVTHKDIHQKLDALERKYRKHDQQFKIVLDALRKLLQSPKEQQVRIRGFTENL